MMSGSADESSGRTEWVAWRRDGPVFEALLNRPDKRNAINDEMMEGISAAFDDAEAAFSDGARVVVVRAAGRVFSSGIDLSQFQSLDENLRDNLFPLTNGYQAVFNKIERCSLPVICVIQGYCLGMALELALACDFRVAVARSKLGLPESRLGIIPDVGGTARLVSLIGAARAKDLIMTGRTIDAEQALQWGLLDAVYAKDELEEGLARRIEELREAAPLSVSYAKRVINDIADVSRGQRIEAWAQASLFRSEDFRNAVRAMLDKTYPIDWEGK